MGVKTEKPEPNAQTIGTLLCFFVLSNKFFNLQILPSISVYYSEELLIRIWRVRDTWA